MGKSSTDHLFGETQPVYSVTDEAEQAVLGAILISGSVALPASMEEGVREDDFSREPYRLIFAVMCAMHRDSEPIDVLTLTDRLGREGILERVGGRSAVDLLASHVPNIGNLRQYARIVVRAAMWRARRRLLLEALDATAVEGEHEFRTVLGWLRDSELHYRPLVTRQEVMGP